MRKKHKARGRAEGVALEQVAAEAGVEIVDAPGAPGDAAEGAADDGAVAADDDAAGADAADPDSVAADPDQATADDGAAETVDGGETLEGSPAGGQVADRVDLDATAEDGEAVARHQDDGVTGDDDGITSSAEEGDEEGEEGDEVVVDPARPQAAALDEVRFKALIEALVFASDKPLTIVRLRQLTRVSDTRRIQAALEQLQADHADSGIILSAVSGGYSFRTHSSCSSWVQQLIQGRPVRLSRAQLETLAIVAYRQPITRPEIDQIRGVDSGATLKLLLDRSLIRILGKREEVGRPLLYGTTKEFLDFFSLSELRELPTLREYSELTAESRSMVAKLGGEPPPEPVVAVAEAEPESVLESEAVTESESEPVPETESVPESDSGSEAEVVAEDVAEPEPGPASEPEPAPEPDGIADPGPDAIISGPDPESRPDDGDPRIDGDEGNYA